MREITTTEVKQIITRGNQLLKFVTSEVGGIYFEHMHHGQSDFKVYSEEKELQGRLLADIDKKKGMVYITWRPAVTKKNFAPRRGFSYDATDDKDDTLDFISWILQIKRELEI